MKQVSQKRKEPCVT